MTIFIFFLSKTSLGQLLLTKIIFQNSLVMIYVFVNWSKYIEKKLKIFLFQLIDNAKNLFDKKVMVNNVASCLFYHSNEHYIYFPSFVNIFETLTFHD
jgi:hypothetical protein